MEADRFRKSVEAHYLVRAEVKSPSALTSPVAGRGCRILGMERRTDWSAELSRLAAHVATEAVDTYVPRRYHGAVREGLALARESLRRRNLRGRLVEEFWAGCKRWEDRPCRDGEE